MAFREGHPVDRVLFDARVLRCGILRLRDNWPHVGSCSGMVQE
ncbi:hypothetical protein BN2537_1509 [Streptomyces venezuelae]|nr:hypothetical protein BN2537_1509 [Streptomyces venezuelae]